MTTVGRWWGGQAVKQRQIRVLLVVRHTDEHSGDVQRLVHFHRSMFAGHEVAGVQQFSWQRIKTQRILLSTGMHLAHESKHLFPLGYPSL